MPENYSLVGMASIIESVYESGSINRSDFLKLYQEIYEFCTEFNLSHDSESIAEYSQSMNLSNFEPDKILIRLLTNEWLKSQIKRALDNVENSPEKAYLETYIHEWEKYRKSSQILSKVCSYLTIHSYWKVDTASIHSFNPIYKMCMVHWEDQMYSKCGEKLYSKLFELIKNQRQSSVIDHDLVMFSKSLDLSLSRIGTYFIDSESKNNSKDKDCNDSLHIFDFCRKYYIECLSYQREACDKYFADAVSKASFIEFVEEKYREESRLLSILNFKNPDICSSVLDQVYLKSYSEPLILEFIESLLIGSEISLKINKFFKRNQVFYDNLAICFTKMLTIEFKKIISLSLNNCFVYIDKIIMLYNQYHDVCSLKLESLSLKSGLKKAITNALMEHFDNVEIVYDDLINYINFHFGNYKTIFNMDILLNLITYISFLSPLNLLISKHTLFLKQRLVSHNFVAIDIEYYFIMLLKVLNLSTSDDFIENKLFIFQRYKFIQINDQDRNKLYFANELNSKKIIDSYISKLLTTSQGDPLSSTVNHNEDNINYLLKLIDDYKNSNAPDNDYTLKNKYKSDKIENTKTNFGIFNPILLSKILWCDKDNDMLLNSSYDVKFPSFMESDWNRFKEDFNLNNKNKKLTMCHSKSTIECSIYLKSCKYDLTVPLYHSIIIHFICQFPEYSFTIKKLATATNLPLDVVSQILSQLEQIELIIKSKVALYPEKENDDIKFTLNLDFRPLNNCIKIDDYITKKELECHNNNIKLSDSEKTQITNCHVMQILKKNKSMKISNIYNHVKSAINKFFLNDDIFKASTDYLIDRDFIMLDENDPDSYAYYD